MAGAGPPAGDPKGDPSGPLVRPRAPPGAPPGPPGRQAKGPTEATLGMRALRERLLRQLGSADISSLASVLSAAGEVATDGKAPGGTGGPPMEEEALVCVRAYQLASAKLHAASATDCVKLLLCM